MKFTSKDIDQLVTGAEPAGKFRPETLVFGEMAVRVIIASAFNHAEELLQQKNTADKGGHSCHGSVSLRGQGLRGV